MNKINPEAKTKIVEALRSGNYPFGRYALQEGGCFCAWGVICDVSGKGEWTPSSQKPDLKLFDGGWMGPSEAVKAWVGVVQHSDVMLTINGLTDNLMSHNDNGVTFAQLADAIEEQL